MHRILFVHNGPTQFVQLDLDELRKHYEVTECYLRSRWVNAVSIWRQVSAHDLVFGWFASWHTFLPLLFARRLGKPSVLVIGGYDVANMPDIGYGHQRGGVKRWVSRHTMRLANRLVTNSYYSRMEAARNALVPEEQVQPLYHGVSDPFSCLPQASRARMALTVGNVDRSNLRRKGHEPFVRAAALMPDVEFTLAGAWKDNAIEHLRSFATPNVTFTGWLTKEELWNYYRRAAVYVQASRHEGFGLSVAEAMLAGCIPVVTKAGALPEVTGEFGVSIAEPTPAIIAQAIKQALTQPDDTRTVIRQTILDRFPMQTRGLALDRLIAQLVDDAH